MQQLFRNSLADVLQEVAGLGAQNVQNVGHVRSPRKIHCREATSIIASRRSAGNERARRIDRRLNVRCVVEKWSMRADQRARERL
jgi:hypothetical protein